MIVGVDISTTRLALADTTGRMASWDWKSGKSGEALARIRRLTEVHIQTFTEGDIDLLAVVYEQPMGKFPDPALMMTVGAVAAGLHDGLCGGYPHPVSVWPINISSWKKASVGFGNASKEQVMAWARSLGLEPANQDEADAMGVAVGGAALIESLAA